MSRKSRRRNPRESGGPEKERAGELPAWVQGLVKLLLSQLVVPVLVQVVWQALR